MFFFTHAAQCRGASRACQTGRGAPYIQEQRVWQVIVGVQVIVRRLASNQSPTEPKAIVLKQTRQEIARLQNQPGFATGGVDDACCQATKITSQNHLGLVSTRLRAVDNIIREAERMVCRIKVKPHSKKSSRSALRLRSGQ
jgi:hypothetical protein